MELKCDWCGSKDMENNIEIYCSKKCYVEAGNSLSNNINKKDVDWKGVLCTIIFLIGLIFLLGGLALPDHSRDKPSMIGFGITVILISIGIAKFLKRLS